MEQDLKRRTPAFCCVAFFASAAAAAAAVVFLAKPKRASAATTTTTTTTTQKKSRKELEALADAALKRLQAAVLAAPTVTAARLPSPRVTALAGGAALGAGEVPLPRTQAIERLFVANERRARWGGNWERTTLLDEWQSSTQRRRYALVHECVKGALGGAISGRDFVQVRVVWHDEARGRSWVALTSVDGVAPPSDVSSSHTRARAITCGSMARDVDGRPDCCMLHSLVHVDPGTAGIPAWVVSKAVSSELRAFFRDVAAAFAS